MKPMSTADGHLTEILIRGMTDRELNAFAEELPRISARSYFQITGSDGQGMARLMRLLGKKKDTDAFFRVFSERSKSPGVFRPEKLLMPLLDGLKGSRLTPSEFRRLFRLVCSAEGEIARTALKNRLAPLRPRSPLLPKIRADEPLMRSYVAGAAYCDPDAVKAAVNGTVLTPVREPDNKYDCLAIKLHLPDGGKIGYIPRAVNAEVAALMDEGMDLFAIVAGSSYGGGRASVIFELHEAELKCDLSK